MEVCNWYKKYTNQYLHTIYNGQPSNLKVGYNQFLVYFGGFLYKD